MIDLNLLKSRKEEIERNMKGLEYVPAPVRERSILDLEAYKELIALRERTGK